MYAELKAALKGAILDPALVLAIAHDGIKVRKGQAAEPARTLFGTHHKVLTTYVARVARGFSVIAGHTFSRGSHPELDYSSEVIHDQHSTFDFSRVKSPYRGIHICRDPRDVLVSCAHYHVKATESWLHEEGYWGLKGTTYQEKLRRLQTMEERLLFEMDHAGGRCIGRMGNWDYANPAFVELRYERMMAAEGFEYVLESLWKSQVFSMDESALLVKLFRIFSAKGVVAHKKHIRNPRPSQWKEHFTPNVEVQFHDRFGPILTKLGYT